LKHERGRHWTKHSQPAALAAALLACAATATTAEPVSPDALPRISVPRLEQTPRLDDFEGMQPRGAALEMFKVSGFIDRLPRDGVPMSERTEVYFGYDSVSLHAVFVCFDRDPSQIRAHWNGRDHVPDSEDSVALQIDTFRDRKHAYGFQVNALGVQQDGTWTEGKGWDLSFDTVWHTEGRLTTGGYLVLVSVPFKSLRFSRESVQSWGFLVFRGIARRNEEGFWPAYSTRIAGRMNQAAVMDGLESVSPGRNAQLVPYLSARSFRTLEVDPETGGRFVSDPAQAEVGADAKLVVKDSLSLDLTANPDFSQVESDEPQVTVNRRFETFFPEKRPFFLENASYFDTPISLLFTRRIVDPDAGVRLTGRLGRYAIGALAVKDQPAARSAEIGILRVNRDLGTESSLGVFASSRRRAGGFNRVGGVDARLKLGANWFATLQAVASATQGSDGNRLSGPAFRAAVLRTGRSLTYNADFNDRSPGFRSELGFIERTDIRSLEQTLSYRRRPAGSRLLSWGPDFSWTEVRDHGNRALDRTITPKLAFEWPGLTRLSLLYQDARVRLRPQEVPSVERPIAFSHEQTGLEFTTSFTPALTLTLEASTGTGINLVPAPGAQPARASLRDMRGKLFPLGVVGAINSALPFSLFAYATLSLTAGFAAVLNATAPLFGALVAYVWLRESLAPTRVAGLLLGFVGVLTLVWGRLSFRGDRLAIVAALLAALCYGIAAHYTKRRLSAAPPLVIATGSQIAAAVLLLPPALLYWPARTPSLLSWLSAITLGVVCTGLAYILYFRLIASAGPVRAIAVTYLIPVFGMLWGLLFLKEPITFNMIAGCAVILLGTAVATGVVALRGGTTSAIGSSTPARISPPGKPS